MGNVYWTKSKKNENEANYVAEQITINLNEIKRQKRVIEFLYGPENEYKLSVDSHSHIQSFDC